MTKQSIKISSKYIVYKKYQNNFFNLILLFLLFFILTSTPSVSLKTNFSYLFIYSMFERHFKDYFLNIFDKLLQCTDLVRKLKLFGIIDEHFLLEVLVP